MTVGKCLSPFRWPESGLIKIGYDFILDSLVYEKGI